MNTTEPDEFQLTMGLDHEWLPLNVWKMMLSMEMGPFPWRPEPDNEATQ